MRQQSRKLVVFWWLSGMSTCMLQVESLQSVVRDRRANWKQSMAALKLAKESGARVTKTSIMLGCGEQPHEVLHAFRTLRDNGELLMQHSDMLPDLKTVQYACVAGNAPCRAHLQQQVVLNK